MRSLFLNFFNLLLFSLCSLTLFSQTPPNEELPTGSLGTATNNGDGQNKAYEVCLDENDGFSFDINLILGGLDFYEEDGNYYGTLPAGVPPMYVQFFVDNEFFDPQEVGVLDLIETPTGLVFSKIFTSPYMDFSDECASDDDGVINKLVGARLVTPANGGGYTVYPACSHPEMFGCYVYSWAPWCASSISPPGFSGPTDPDPTCYNEWYEASYSVDFHCDCDIVAEPPYEPTKNTQPFKDNGSGSDTRSLTGNTLNVYPNPMGEMLQIDSDGGNIEQVLLYNTNGELIMSQKYPGKNNSSISLDASELPTGLYLIKISTNSGIEVVKVLK